MRKSLMILLLLAGCEKKPAEIPDDPAGAAANDLLANLSGAMPGEDPARVQALVDAAMPGILKNPKEAQYRNVRAGAGGSACGEVAAKAGAPFLPFVVSPGGVAVLGTKPQIAWEDPNDFLADAWIRWCATPEELEALGPRLAGAKADPLANEVSAAIPPPLDPSLPGAGPPAPAAPPPAAPAAPAPAPKPAKPAPRPEIDSFFNSVQRQDR